MPDLRKFGQTLNRILPFLANEKMQRENIRRWLESNLQELSAREASQGRLQTQEAQDVIARILGASTTEALEPIAGGRQQMPKALMETLAPRYTGGIRVPPEYSGEVTLINTALEDMTAQAQSGQDISREVIRALGTQVAPGIYQDMVKASMAGKLERGRQSHDINVLAKDIAGQKLRERELDIQEKGLGVGGKKDAAAVMKEAQNDREASILKYGGVGNIFGLSDDAEQALKGSIKNANRRIDAASKAAGIESPIKTPQEMLKAGLAILTRYGTKGELPSWYDLLFLGYDPDFVFGLQKILEKPDEKANAPNEKLMKQAMALIQAIQTGRVE